MKKLNIVTATKFNLKGVDSKFNEALSKWMESAEKKFQSEISHYEGRPEEHLGIMDGKKFARVTIFRDGKPASAFAFIDKTNGDLLKSATWKAPAKHARGNLFDESGGLKWVTPYGMEYLKR